MHGAQFICQDLIRGVVEYIPRSDLRVLSRASPIFDREICLMGIKVIYRKKGYTGIPIIPRNNETIIVTDKGEIMALQFDNIAFYIDRFTKVYYENYRIIETVIGDPFKEYHVNNDGSIAVCQKNRTMEILRGHAVSTCRKARVPLYIDFYGGNMYDDFMNIDMNSCKLMYSIMSGISMKVSIYGFRVLMRNGSWEN